MKTKRIILTAHYKREYRKLAESAKGQKTIKNNLFIAKRREAKSKRFYRLFKTMPMALYCVVFKATSFPHKTIVCGPLWATLDTCALLAGIHNSVNRAEYKVFSTIDIQG